MPRNHYTIEERIAAFWAKTEKRGECLVWIGGGTGKGGYGLFKWGELGLKVATHVAYFLGHGVWPTKGKVIMHTCDNPPCVRLDHLVEGTHLENTADALRKGRPIGRPRKAAGGTP